MPEIRSKRTAQATVAKRQEWKDEPRTDERFEGQKDHRYNIHHGGSQSGPQGHGQDRGDR
jgi:hypothetical protein